MQDDNEELDISFSFALGDNALTDSDQWSSWEQSRSRSFALAGPLTIGDGKLGKVANLEMQLECKRISAGFEASWTLSMDEQIGPWRINRGEAMGYLVDAGNTRVVSFPMPELARACGTRRHQWNGSLTKDQFDKITSFTSDGDVTVRRC